MQNDKELSFTQSNMEKRSWLPWIVAGVVIVGSLGILVVIGGHRAAPITRSGPALAPLDPYAANLLVSNIHMSEATNFAGGKMTYIDGTIANHGATTLKSITVQVVFRNDLKEIAQKETMPLSLIRTHEPYVDTGPVSAAPLRPEDEREFRLIFDSVATDWNRQYPEVRIVQAMGK